MRAPRRSSAPVGCGARPRVRGVVVVLAAACLVATAGTAAAPAAQDGAGWLSRYAEGLAAARAHGAPFLVYFPPTGSSSDPSVIARADPASLGLPIVRIGTEEVAERMTALGVGRVPALLVVDRRENVIARFEGSIGAAVWRSVDAVRRRMARRRSDELKAAGRAVELLEDGRVESALDRVRPLLEDRLTSPEAFEIARRVHGEVAEREENEMLRALAAEGLVPARELERRLRELRERVLLDETRARIDRELTAIREDDASR